MLIWTTFFYILKVFLIKNLKPCKNVEVSLNIRSDAIWKFCIVCPIPYVLKDRVEKELECFFAEGILKSISYSEWATPLVPIVKPDNSICVCGDYKQTANKASSCDQYPVPMTKDLLASLSALWKVYQTLFKFLIPRVVANINTHKGLFQPTEFGHQEFPKKR